MYAICFLEVLVYSLLLPKTRPQAFIVMLCAFARLWYYCLQTKDVILQRDVNP
jgi:hypothetical protein